MCEPTILCVYIVEYGGVYAKFKETKYCVTEPFFNTRSYRFTSTKSDKFSQFDE